MTAWTDWATLLFSRCGPDRQSKFSRRAARRAPRRRHRAPCRAAPPTAAPRAAALRGAVPRIAATRGRHCHVRGDPPPSGRNGPFGRRGPDRGAADGRERVRRSAAERGSAACPPAGLPGAGGMAADTVGIGGGSQLAARLPLLRLPTGMGTSARAPRAGVRSDDADENGWVDAMRG